MFMSEDTLKATGEPTESLESVVRRMVIAEREIQGISSQVQAHEKTLETLTSYMSTQTYQMESLKEKVIEYQSSGNVHQKNTWDMLQTLLAEVTESKRTREDYERNSNANLRAFEQDSKKARQDWWLKALGSGGIIATIVLGLLKLFGI